MFEKAVRKAETENGGNIDEHKNKYEYDAALSGIPTGFGSLDQLTGGMRKQELILLGSRPAMGKTTFMIDILRYVGQELGKCCVVFSMKHSTERIMERMARAGAFIETGSKEYDEEEKERLLTERKKFNDSEIHIVYSPQETVEDMKRQCLEMKKSRGIDFVAIDELQMIKAEEGQSSYEKMTGIITKLKQLSEVIDCPVLVLSQLSPEIEERDDRRPTVEDLGEARAFVEVGDETWLLYRDEYYDKYTELKGIAEITAYRGREKRPGMVKMAFLPGFPRFMEFDKRFD